MPTLSLFHRSHHEHKQERATAMKVGFIGLGNMGAGMAANLLKAGHEVTVYNRTRAKADELVKQGATAATGVSDVCRADAVMTMLANDEAVESVVYGDQGVLARLARGAVHISSSTISVALSERLAADHASAGQRLLAAPPFRPPHAAAPGQLFLLAPRARAGVEGVAPLFGT